LEKDPWGVKEPGGFGGSVTSSPRSKATRVSYSQSEYQLMAAFVKSNLKLFLRLVSTDIHNKDVSLSATEFNTLRILFNIEGKTTGKQLSSYAPFFQQPQSSQTNKVHMNIISEWINSLLMPGESNEGVLKMNSLNKCVTVKRHDEIQYNFGNT
jgi:hypothetical protein